MTTDTAGATSRHCPTCRCREHDSVVAVIDMRISLDDTPLRQFRPNTLHLPRLHHNDEMIDRQQMNDAVQSLMESAPKIDLGHPRNRHERRAKQARERSTR